MGTKSYNAQEGEAFFKMELSPVKPSGASGGGAQEGGALTAESRRWGLLRATRRSPSETCRGRKGGWAQSKIELSPQELSGVFFSPLQASAQSSSRKK